MKLLGAIVVSWVSRVPDDIILVRESLVKLKTLEAIFNHYSYYERIMPSQCGAAAERTTRDREVPGSKLACAVWLFP